MKQQFIGQFHCKCGTSWRRDIVSASTALPACALRSRTTVRSMSRL
ncbi:hypothetical protein NE589_09100 [Faecalibacterium prausnitzii]|nr:hypothetical protein [Faecalibacterium prausnitzii]MCQ4887240.1 hypothetical protein [Faecalibacterium prausnitzii]